MVQFLPKTTGATEGPGHRAERIQTPQTLRFHRDRSITLCQIITPPLFYKEEESKITLTFRPSAEYHSAVTAVAQRSFYIEKRRRWLQAGWFWVLPVNLCYE